ncbi:BglG family transcriptional antiterminator [Enterococcus pernyi]|uniref:PRD domain-containing protein n=2 Tax=Enterococcus mundtii TaxID=53346 RepID=A0A1V2UEB3_ENTMU|nr:MULTISPECIES: PRD domain-containing protein [Enterococcus]EOH63595.1 BglG family transcriptional antiterminator [Enterococcus mundtii ATCC 882]EOU13424.1 BglG family transcriptional antiterminator [Enterococcus mundtii ATCC 882]NMP57857.1 PRD domain-containing protein [Enterococcus mundtii]ONN41459.1 transcription antiterminator BglG [Enterococcus mundtii]PJK26975.1 transcription antiterminator BglG [Enterococcus mundtii]
MVIEKVLNNNVVISKNELGEEIICMGKGLAFQKKSGDTISEESIQKEFVLKDSFTTHQFQQLMADVPLEEVELVKQIVDLAEEQLNIQLSPNIYLTLTDHIHYAISRAKENIELPNPLLFETKKFYPKEYRAAKQALQLVEEKLGVTLPMDEAGFIAFHFVNSEQGNGDMQVTMAATKMVRDILSIISKFFGIAFDEDSLNYQRIITHLQFFTQRYLKDEASDEKDEFLYALVQGKYPKAFRCVERINEYLIQTQQKEMGPGEQIYLTIHIQRVVTEKQTQS